MTEGKGDYITEEEVKEGLELLHGVPLVEFQPPADQIIETDRGEFEIAQSLGWVKFSAAFRLEMLKRLKGARLSVFLCICLHLNERGEAFPGLETIAQETGYDRETVMQAVGQLEDISGLLEVSRRRGSKNVYRPAYAARGKRAEPTIPEKPVQKNPTSGGPVLKTPTGLVKSSGNLPVISDSKKREELKRDRETPLDFSNMTVQEAQRLPTLRMYSQATHFFPGSVLWEKVHNTILEHKLDYATLHNVAVAWLERGFRLENVGGILDWAIHGIPKDNRRSPELANVYDKPDPFAALDNYLEKKGKHENGPASH